MLLFFFTEYKNEWKQNKFRRKTIDFYNNKDKKIFNIDDIDVNKILVSKKEQYGKYKYFIHSQIFHLNTLLSIMKMILLDDYV